MKEKNEIGVSVADDSVSQLERFAVGTYLGEDLDNHLGPVTDCRNNRNKQTKKKELDSNGVAKTSVTVKVYH